jgi:hypothetical protein
MGEPIIQRTNMFSPMWRTLPCRKAAVRRRHHSPSARPPGTNGELMKSAPLSKIEPDVLPRVEPCARLSA